MRRKLIVFPFNGNGLEAIDCLGQAFELVGFVDDAVEKHGRHGAAEVYSRKLLDEVPEAQVLAVPGSPTSFRGRKALIASLGISDERFACVVHPRACVADPRNLGRNVLVMAGVVVTSNARIGNHVCLLPNAVVHHDVVIGDYTLVGSNVTLAGGVRVGEGCYLGSGSRFISGAEVGEGALVGLGANVIRHVAPGSRVAGNPARPLP
ncbi:MAG TPA: acetyltransferase [Vicinamibacterales bacterium]|nr:acetyltransferase [Vicinamibacterales bacterium]